MATFWQIFFVATEKLPINQHQFYCFDVEHWGEGLFSNYRVGWVERSETQQV